MRRPLLSVLLPYRDAAPTLPQAVESVLAERCLDLELLAIDDGSSDEGPGWVARRGAGEPRLRPLRTGGVGIARALQAGLQAARAPFVARMDADDVSLPGRLQASLELLEREPALDVVAVQVDAWPPAAAGIGLLRYVAWQNGIRSPEAHLRERFVESPLCHPAVTARREALLGAGGYREGPFPEDYELWLRLLERGARFAKVPRRLLRWRHAPGRATFSDPRCSPAALRALKARFLARWLGGRRWALWGAGPSGRRLCREMEQLGCPPARFVDVHVPSGGRRVRGLPLDRLDSLDPRRERVVVAVGLPSARPLVRRALAALGFREPRDAVFAA